MTDGTTARYLAGPRDALRLQAFTAEAIGTAGQSGYLHAGDVPHRVFSGLRHDDPTLQVRIWEDSQGIVADSYHDDTIRIELLESAGWVRGTEPYVLTQRPLDAVPRVSSPGYVVRSVRGVDPTGALQAASFGSWAPGEYRAFMEAPGYAAEHKLVAEDEDERWLDSSLCGSTR